MLFVGMKINPKRLGISVFKWKVLVDMSYTMTIEAPEKAAWFERQRTKLSAAELGELFVLFLSERMAHEAADERNPFEAFCGTWDDAQFAEFQNAASRSVNPSDWQ